MCINEEDDSRSDSYSSLKEKNWLPPDPPSGVSLERDYHWFPIVFQLTWDKLDHSILFIYLFSIYI